MNKKFDKARLILVAVLILGALLNIVLMNKLPNPGAVVAEDTPEEAVVLKGSGTIIAFPEGESYILGVGNPGMAKGGSGDVLTGITAAMLAQLPFRQAICTAAWLHSAAADACAEALGEYGMTPSDIIEKLPITMKGITRTRHETNDPVADDDPVSHRV